MPPLSFLGIFGLYCYNHLIVATRYEHIILKNEVPHIAGTTMKVVELVQEYLSTGHNTEELQQQHSYLTLGQIHSALAYYWDHRQALDDDMERRFQLSEALRAAPVSPAVARLKELERTQLF